MNRRVLALVLILLFFVSFYHPLPPAQATATRLMGVNLFTAIQNIPQDNIEAIAGYGANEIEREVPYTDWNTNTWFRNYVIEIRTNAQAVGMDFILCCFGPTFSTTDADKYNAVYDSAKRAEWINNYKNIITILQPDGVTIMNEPPSTIDADDLKDFYLSCIDSWRIVKSDLYFVLDGQWVESTGYYCPFSLNGLLDSPRVDESRPTVTIYYAIHHYYYFLNVEGSDPILEEYWTGDLGNAQTDLWDYFDTFCNVTYAESEGLNIFFEEFGCHILNPNYDAYMNDCFTYAGDHGISINWVSWYVNDYTTSSWNGTGMIDDFDPTLSDIGIIWANFMSYGSGFFLWSYTTGNPVYSSPTVSGGIVYIGSDDGQLYALNVTTGAKIWNYSTSWEIRDRPTVSGGIVYFGCLDNNVYALDATTGTQIWNYTTGDQVSSSPTVNGGIVYIGSDDNRIYALNATDGSWIWENERDEDVHSSPFVTGGIVYVGVNDGQVFALNATDGAYIWSYATGNDVESSPFVINGIMYVGSNDDKVYALNATDGSWIWDYTTDANVESSPVVVSGILYVGSRDANVYALNATDGSWIWNYTTWGGDVKSSPAVSSGVVYIGSDKYFYNLDASTGAEIWNYTSSAGIFDSSPFVAGGVAYVGGCTDNRVYAFYHEMPSGDSESPTYALLTYSSTIAGSLVKFTVTSDDNIALDYIIFTTNNTGTWTPTAPITFTATPQQVNVSKVLTSSSGVKVGYRWIITDTSGNINDTGVHYLTTTAPSAPPSSPTPGTPSAIAIDIYPIMMLIFLTGTALVFITSKRQIYEKRI